ncbi:MAG TPA: hypothetical protein VK686_07655 [Bryobacteraceae bacterium]|jgi:hypothetical protein|nr:hypothetical protein [Bryobacteraceae bacterium]
MLDTTYLLWYSSIVVQFLFCLYLVWTRLAKSYPIFAIYLAVSVLSSLCGIYFMRGADGPRLPLAYTYYWLCAEPVILLAQIAVTLEVHAGMWRGHEAVVRQTRPLLLFALLTALVSAGIPVRAELARTGTSHLIAVMHFGFLVTRYISSVLAIFLVLSAALFLIAVHNGIASSVFRHEGMLTLYFGIYAIATFLVGMGWSRAVFVNSYLASALTLCFVLWFSVFRPLPLPSE